MALKTVHSILQFARGSQVNRPGQDPYVVRDWYSDARAFGLKPATLIVEGLGVEDQRRRAKTASLPPNELLMLNCEAFGERRNTKIACDILDDLRLAGGVDQGAYVTEAHLPVWDAVGQGAESRRKSVALVRWSAKALAEVSDYIPVDGFTYLGDRITGEPIKDWYSASWCESWRVQVGEKGTLLEAFTPRVVVMLSNRVHSNALPLTAPEPLIPQPAFLNQIRFCLDRGWEPCVMLGWSDWLKRTSGRGFLAITDRDYSDLLEIEKIIKS